MGSPEDKIFEIIKGICLIKVGNFSWNPRYMYEIQEKLTLWLDLENPLFDDAVADMDKRSAIYCRVNKMWLYINVKTELPL